MVGRRSKASAKIARKAAAKRVARKAAKARRTGPKSQSLRVAKPALLAGGNPQIAKADGDAPVQAYIAAADLDMATLRVAHPGCGRYLLAWKFNAPGCRMTTERASVSVFAPIWPKALRISSIMMSIT